MLSERALALKPSATLALTAKTKEMKRQGIDVIDLGIGEPDFNTPENVKAAGKKAIDNNFTHYTAASGIDELKEAICRKLKRENNIDYEKLQVIVSCGAKHVLYNLMQVLLNHGDEAIVLSPYWVSYVEQIKIAGGVPVIVESEENFHPHIEKIKEAVTKKTKALILNSPNNPSGAVLTENEIKSICEICEDQNIVLISDEVYEKFVYDGKHQSAAKYYYDNTVTVNAVSKTYAMTGWRIGYAAGPKEIISAMSNLQSQSTSNPTSIAQYASVEALDGEQHELQKMIDEYRKRRDFVYSALKKISGIKIHEPEGAFYVFPDISKFGNSSDFSKSLLENAKVAVVPGIEFGNDNCVRISYACSIQGLEKAMKRIEEYCQ